MGILDTSTETSKQSDIDEILGFLAALEKVRISSFKFFTKKYEHKIQINNILIILAKWLEHDIRQSLSKIRAEFDPCANLDFSSNCSNQIKSNIGGY